MKTLRSITAILFLTLAAALTARAQDDNIFKKIFPPAQPAGQQQTASSRRSPDNRSRRRLREENDSLRQQVQQLQDEIAQYKESLADEIRDQEEAEDEALGLPLEDYTAEATDSLLSVWYLHRQAQLNDEGEGFNLDSVTLASSVPDSVIIQRLKKINSFISLPYNETVRNYIILYSEKMPTKMGQIMGLSTYYFPIFEETLNHYGMPEELKYMAVIESALNPTAVSRARAKGMWQFIFSTARNYGLEINSYVDERLDPFQSADAAARYLKDAYQIFGDWSLAISSYNCGSGNVNKAIRRSGGRRDFWSIYPYLPRETRGYVPAMVGAMYAMTYYKECGIEPEPVHLPSHIDTFHIHKNLHFRQVSEVIGIPMVELRDLNPQYFNDIIPGDSGDYILRLPFHYSSAFVDKEATIYDYEKERIFSDINVRPVQEARRSGSSGGSGSGEWVYYKVRSGDSLGKIAARYHVTVNQLKTWNNLKGTTIRIGQRLRIRSKGGASVSSSASGNAPAASSASAPAAKSSGGTGEYTTYIVKSGDSLYSIAKHYPGVSADDIMRANGISANIRPGMRLKIPKK